MLALFGMKHVFHTSSSSCPEKRDACSSNEVKRTAVVPARREVPLLGSLGEGFRFHELSRGRGLNTHT